MPKTNGEKNPQFSFASDDPPPKPQPTQQDHAQLLLNFLQRWAKPTISVRDMRIWGPKLFRDPKKAIDAAQVLVRNQWLTPTKPRRREPYRWQVVRKNIVHPVVES